MKTKLLYSAAAVLILSVGACQEKEISSQDDGQGNNGTIELIAPELTSNSTDISISKENLDSEVLKLTWNSALPEGVNTELTYTVYANLSSKDLYSSPQTFPVGDVLTHSFTGKELNELCAKLKVLPGESTELQFSVYVKNDVTEDSAVSDILKVKVITYKEKIEIPDVLWIAGSATDAGWDLSKSIELPKGSDGVYKAENVNINLTISDTGFKFYFAKDDTSEAFFGPDRASDEFGKAMLYLTDDGSANLFQPAMSRKTSGKYTIIFNPETMMMSMERTGDLSYELQLGENIYPQGDCFPWHWAFTDPMTKVSENIYEIQNVKCSWGDKGDSGFKIFIADGVYSPYFAQADDASMGNITVKLVTDTDVPQFKPGLLGYTDGTYTIRADFNTMVLTLEKIETPEPGFDEKSAMYILGGGFSKYEGNTWEFARERALIPQGDGTYVSEKDIYLDKWCYFQFATGDWGKKYVRNASASSYWSAKAKETDDDPNFTPGDSDPEWIDGWYKIVFDENNMTVTCTKSSGSQVIDPDKAFYLYGAGFENIHKDWEFNDSCALMPTSEGVYESVEPIYLPENSYFKFEKRDWTEYVRDAGASEYWKVTPRQKGPDNDKCFVLSEAGLKTGTYNVKLDLNTSTVHMSLVK